MNNPLVSIIVRTKDRPRLLKRALQSIAFQTYMPIEVVLVNDGGCDLEINELKTILGDVALNYLRLENNMGRAYAGNAGIENAKGEYIGFLDDDDEFYENHIEILRGACSSKDIHVAYSSVQAVFYKWTDSEKIQFIRLNNSHLYNDSFNPSRLLFENYIPLNALLFSRGALSKEFFDQHLQINEDWDLLIRLSRHCKFVFVPQITAEYSLFPKDEARQDMEQIAGDRRDIHSRWLKVVFDKNKSLITGADWAAFYLGYLIPKHEQEIQSLRNLLTSEQSRLEAEVKNRLDQLQQGSRELFNQAAAIRQRDEELIRQNAVIQQRDEELFKQNFMIQQRDEELIRQNAVIQQRDEELFKQNFMIQQRDEELIRQNAVIKQRDEELVRQNAVIKQRDEELVRQNAVIKQRDEELVRQNAVIKQRDEELFKQNFMIQQRDEELIRQNAVIQQRDEELIRQNAVIQQRDEELSGILTSESWKITYPLREAGKFARFLRKSVRYAARNKPSMVFRRAAVEMYHSPIGGSWLRFLPPTVKQGVKSWLLARETPVSYPEISATDPRVSIIIPVFNHAEYLDKCISSAINQDYQNLEVVVVDDFSTDPSVKIILQKYMTDKRVKLLFNEKNMGIADTQNRAIINSTGDIIAFLDCDDYLSADAVSSSLKHWKLSTVYLHTARTNIDKNNSVVNRISFEHLPRTDYFTENLERMYATHFKMIRKNAFATVGLFDPRFDSAQDYDMLMRIAFHYPSSSFVFVPNFVYFHRLHDRQETSRNEDKQSTYTKIIQEEARKRKKISEGIFEKNVSIIMLSYGKYEQTIEAIDSLAGTVKIPVEVILFDNGSDNETVNFLKSEITDEKYPFVKKIFNKENLGPAEGRRQALKHAKGPYYITFDNDEIAQPKWIEELLVRAETSPDIGAVVARVFFPDNKLQFSGGGVRYIDHELVELTRSDVNKSIFDVSAAFFKECDWVPIGATLFKVNPAPYLHSGYQNIFEDAGVSFALRKQGYRLVNAPGALVLHNHFMYRDTVSMKSDYLKARYNQHGMLRAIASFFIENNLIIYDEYVWKENGLHSLPREELKQRLLTIYQELKRS